MKQVPKGRHPIMKQNAFVGALARAPRLNGEPSRWSGLRAAARWVLALLAVGFLAALLAPVPASATPVTIQLDGQTTLPITLNAGNKVVIQVTLTTQDPDDESEGEYLQILSSGGFSEVLPPDGQTRVFSYVATQDGETFTANILGGDGGDGDELAVLTIDYEPELKVIANPEEGGTVDGGGHFPAGSQQEIFAGANDDYEFTKWDDGSKENPRTVTVPAEGATYTAIFKKKGAVKISCKYADEDQHVYFINGASLNVTFQAMSSDPNYTDFEWSVNGGDWQPLGASAAFNVGTGFGVGGRLQARGVTDDGQYSDPANANFDVIPPPPLVDAATLEPSDEEPLKYTHDGTKFEAGFLGTNGIGTDTKTGKTIPFLSGHPYDVHAAFDGSVVVWGTGFAQGQNIKASKDSDFKFGKLDADTKIGAGLGVNWTYNPGGQSWNIGGSIFLTLGAEKDFTEYFSIIPPVYGTVTVGAEGTGELDITSVLPGGGDLGLSGSLGVKGSLKGTIGLGLVKILNVEGYLKGEGSLSGIWNPGPQIVELGVTLSGGFKATALIFDFSYEAFSYSWVDEDFTPGFHQAMSQALQPASFSDPSVWKLKPRAPASFSPLALQPAPSFGGMSGEVLLQANSFPQGQSALTTAGGLPVLFSIADDPARSSANRTELTWRPLGADGTWGAPVAVENDGTGDYAPTAAALPNGQILVGWQNTATALPDTATLADALAAQEISVATLDPQSGTVATSRLTNDSTLDHSPALAAAGDGTAFIAWISNAANDLMGTAAAPNQIRCAFYRDGAWQASTVAADNLGAIAQLTVGYINGTPTVLFCRDTDNDLSTVSDQELQAVQFDGTAWGAVQALTSDNLQDTSPQIVQLANNHQLVMWLHDGDLWAANDLNLAQGAAVAAVGLPKLNEFRSCADAGGRVYVAAAGIPDGVTPGIYLLQRDTAGTWNSPLIVAGDSTFKRSVALVTDDAGDVVLAYNKVQLTTDASGAPISGEVDLAAYLVLAGTDLTVTGLQLNPAQPALGDTVQLSATVANAGLTASGATTVSFLLRDGVHADSVIGSADLDVVAPGASATVSVSWTASPLPAGSEIVAVVDPGNVVTETDETNNELVLEPFLPDLAVTGISVQTFGATLQQATVTIQNLGLVDVPAGVTVSAYLGSTAGPVLASNILRNPLPAGGTIQTRLQWSAGTTIGTTAQSKVVVVADPGNRVAEFRKDNNSSGALVPSAGTALAAAYGSATEIPVTAAQFNAAGLSVNLALRFAPTPGTQLTVIHNTGGKFIQGAFSNLAQGQLVSLTYQGVTYTFVADYYGGSTGRDLVLVWADNRLAAWGENVDGELGAVAASGYSSTPLAVTGTGALAGKTIVAVAAGQYHTLALSSDGKLAAWGLNADGELGNGDANYANSGVPVAVDQTSAQSALNGKTVVAIAAGGLHSLALCSDGTVAAWGANADGQLGNSDATLARRNVPVAVDVSGALSGQMVVAIAAGLKHSLALCADGSLVAWGFNGNGELGIGNNSSQGATPVALPVTDVLSSDIITAIAAGGSHNLALGSRGAVYAWGLNTKGQLGDGDNTFSSEFSPVLVDQRPGVSAFNNRQAVAIAAGQQHSLALCADGALVAWGYNADGELGTASYVSASNEPGLVVQSSGALMGKRVASIAAGSANSYALCTDGTLASWGFDGRGELGTYYYYSNSQTPIAVDTSVLSTGEMYSAIASGPLAHHAVAVIGSPDIIYTPTVSAPVSFLTSTSATLTGLVNAHGSATTVAFVYGLDTSYGSSAPAFFSPNNGTTPQFVSVALTGLQTGVTYHYSLTANNQYGSVATADDTFTPLGTFSPTFANSQTIGLTATDFAAAGNTLGPVTFNFAPMRGGVYILVKNNGSGPVNGIFNGLPQGAVVSTTVGGRTYYFRISYTGGDGNDITLTETPVPYTWTNFAGEPAQLGSVNGLGGNALFVNPTGIAVDGNDTIYVAEWANNTVRKITADGLVSTLAGAARTYGSTDGTGTAALFNNPQSVAVDPDGNVFVADTDNSTIRKITPDGVVTTFAGVAGLTGSTDGTGGAARFDHPNGVGADANGNVFVADSNNNTIRKITPAAVVSTLAGQAGVFGSVDGPGATAIFFHPTGVAADDRGHLFVADAGNNTIRKITSGGVVSTVAGSAGVQGGLDGVGKAAQFNNPYGLVVDRQGTIYVADTGNHTIRRVTSDGTVTTVGGSAGNNGSADGIGTLARFYLPEGVAVNSKGQLLVSDTDNFRISEGTPGFPIATATAADNLGNGTARLNGTVNPNGNPTSAQFEYGLTTAYGKVAALIVTPNNGTTAQAVQAVLTGVRFGVTYHYRLRAANQFGEFTTQDAIFNALGAFSPVFTSAATVPVTSNGFTATGNSLAQLTFDFAPAPGGVYTLVQNTGSSPVEGTFTGLPEGSLVPGHFGTKNFFFRLSYMGGTGNDVTLTEDLPYSWANFAGSPGSYGHLDGLGAAAQLASPAAVAVDASGNLYVADAGGDSIRKITKTGLVTTLAGGSYGNANGTGAAAQFDDPQGVAVEANGNVYVADTYNEAIRKITPAGVVTTLAGGTYGSTDGTGSAARFYYPQGVAVDAKGNVYVADTNNHTIRKVTSAGVVTTLAGLPGQPGSADGAGSAARFSAPHGLAVAANGTIYVADLNNSTIRKITPAGVVTTLAGLPGVTGAVDGSRGAARFDYPSGVALDAQGNLFVADQSNQLIRKVTADGLVSTIGGQAGNYGSNDGVEGAARFYSPAGVAVTPAGLLYVADRNNYRISLGYPGFPPAVTATGATNLAAGVATLHGTVNANGAATIAKFEYGLTTAYGSSAPVTFTPVDGSVAQSVSAALTGLKPGVTYHFRLTATNQYAVRSTADGTFNALGAFSPQLTSAGAAALTTSGFNATGNSLATVNFAFAPVRGAVYTLVSNTGAVPLTGQFSNARQGTVIGGKFNGVTYFFTISYGPNAVTIQSPAYSWTNFAGQLYYTGRVDATGPAARFYYPQGIAVDASGTVYVADSDNNAIRKITSDAVVTTFAGGTYGGTNGTGTGASFAYPRGVAVDAAGVVYVADTNNNTIRMITPAGVVTTLAGGVSGNADATGTDARFNNPEGIAVDSGGTVYVADTSNYAIRKITAGGVVTTLAGGSYGSADGTGTAARFAGPTGIAVDGSGQVFVSDTNNQTIRKITSAGVVTTLAGLHGVTGMADGQGSDARFYYPQGVGADADGNVYVADADNQTIRRINPAGQVTTIGGWAQNGGSADGFGAAAQFSNPGGIAAGPAGLLYVVDTYNQRISRGQILDPAILAAPAATTLPVTGLSSTSCVLHGTANANGVSTLVSFDYGLTPAHGGSATASPAMVTGSTDTAVSATVSGLLPGTTYHFRTRAMSLGGTALATEGSFTTVSNDATLASLGLSVGDARARVRAGDHRLRRHRVERHLIADRHAGGGPGAGSRPGQWHRGSLRPGERRARPRSWNEHRPRRRDRAGRLHDHELPGGRGARRPADGDDAAAHAGGRHRRDLQRLPECAEREHRRRLRLRPDHQLRRNRAGRCVAHHRRRRHARQRDRLRPEARHDLPLPTARRQRGRDGGWPGRDLHHAERCRDPRQPHAQRRHPQPAIQQRHHGIRGDGSGRHEHADAHADGRRRQPGDDHPQRRPRRLRPRFVAGRALGRRQHVLARGDGRRRLEHLRDHRHPPGGPGCDDARRVGPHGHGRHAAWNHRCQRRRHFRHLRLRPHHQLRPERAGHPEPGDRRVAHARAGDPEGSHHGRHVSLSAARFRQQRHRRWRRRDLHHPEQCRHAFVARLQRRCAQSALPEGDARLLRDGRQRHLVHLPDSDRQRRERDGDGERRRRPLRERERPHSAECRAQCDQGRRHRAGSADQGALYGERNAHREAPGGHHHGRRRRERDRRDAERHRQCEQRQHRGQL